jgi:transposase
VFVGIDLHKRYTYRVVLKARGDVLDEGRLRKQAVTAYVAGLAAPVHVTLEATFNWQALVEQLAGKVAGIVLAHPKHVKAIASARIKTDKIDAHVLADRLRTNLLPAAYIPSRDARDWRDLVRYRAHITRQRTQLKNRGHAILARYGFQRPTGGRFTKPGIAFLHDLPLRPEYPNQVWSYDFMPDRTPDGRSFRILNVIDEYTREGLATVVKRKLTHEDVMIGLTKLFCRRGMPAYIRSDNGPEFIAKAVRHWLKQLDVVP